MLSKARNYAQLGFTLCALVMGLVFYAVRPEVVQAQSDQEDGVWVLPMECIGVCYGGVMICCEYVLME